MVLSMSIRDVLTLNIDIIMRGLDSILNSFLEKSDNIDARYGLFSLGKSNRVLVNSALAGDLLISYIYRQLQYGYPPCWEVLRDEEKCTRSKRAKLEFTYIMASALDEVFSSIRIRRQILKAVLQGILENKNLLSLRESINAFLSWFLENYENKERVKEVAEKLESLDDEYIGRIVHELIERIRIDKRNGWIDDVMEAKLFKVRGFDEHIRSILEEGDVDKLVKASLIGLVLDGFTWLRPLIHELAALYVYIYNDRRILPFGPMQHVIEGGYTWSITLGDFIDPETNSLIDVKSSVERLRISPLIRMSVELRMPIHIVVPHYVKRADGKPDTSKIYLSIYL